MADSEKKDSSVKEKNLLLDIDLGENFLSSWDSISVAEGNGMDFDLLPGPKGNKKSLNLGKADFDFDLGGDFGKIASFDIDMSDLEISPSLKKDGKSKEKSNESSSGKDKEKSDHFDFDFDFDKMDAFSFEPSLKREGSRSERAKNNKEGSPDGKTKQDKAGSMRMDLTGNTSKLKGFPRERFLPETDFNLDMDCLVGKNLTREGSRSQREKNNKEISSDGRTVRDDEGSMNMDLTGNTSTVKSVPQEPTLPDTNFSLDTNYLVGRSKDVDNPKKNLPSNVTAYDAITSVNSATTDELASDRRSDPPQRAISSIELPKINQSEKLDSAEPVEVATCSGNDGKLDLSCDCLLNNKLNNSSVTEEKADCMDTSPTGTNIEQRVCFLSVSGLSDNNENTTPENLRHVQSIVVPEKNCCDKHEAGINDCVEEVEERHEPGKVNSLVEKPCAKRPVSGMLGKMPSARESLDTASENLKLPSARQPNHQLEKEAMKRSEPVVTSLRSFLQSEKLGCPLRKAATQNELLSSSSKKMDPTDPSAVEGRESDGSQAPRKLLPLSCQHPTTLLKDIPQNRSQENCKAQMISREINADGLQDAEQPPDHSTAQNKELAKTKSALNHGELGAKGLHTLRNQISSMETGNKSVQNNRDHTSLSSIPSTKSIRAEEQKLSSTDTGTAPKLSGLNLGSEKLRILKDIKSGTNISGKKILSTKPSSEILRSPDLHKQIPRCLSVKRKALEKDAADTLHPPKRLSHSLTTTRDLAKSLETIHDGKLISQEDKSSLGSCEASNYQIDKIRVEVVACIAETGTNIKLAEAYGKELNNLCNKLKKMNDEAKELLVRSVVNNTKMLMLHTPAFAKKVNETQKLLAQLTLNAIQE